MFQLEDLRKLSLDRKDKICFDGMCGINQVLVKVSGRLLCPWAFLGKSARMDCHFFLQGNLPNPGIKHVSFESPALQVDSLPTEPQGKPI